MKTANLAIVFTDIKGFTERTSQQTLQQNQRLLDLHASLLTPLFRAFGGRIIKSIGDAFLVTFESPTQAVLSGIAIQDRLWMHNRTAEPDERFQIRIAINVGEVRLESGDVFGEPVNIASRVEGVAEVGEVFFTEAVYLAMNKAEVPSEEVGQFELKGIPGKVRVFRVPKGPYRVEPAPATAAEQPPFGNLGLSKLSEAPPAAVLGARAAELGQKAVAIVSQARPKMSRARWYAVGAGVGVAGLIALVASLSHSKIDTAIAAVAAAPPEQRESKAEAARALIDAETDRPTAELHRGRLDEVLGRDRDAIRHYRASAKDGQSQATSRLIDLLESPRCWTREAAASALGALKLKKAKGPLESLAEKGGTDDDDIPLIGCNSRRAAQEALRQLE